MRESPQTLVFTSAKNLQEVFCECSFEVDARLWA